MKYRSRLHPGDYALGENEKFYSDMEAKGWRLVKRGARRSKFERVEPKKMRYRVEVVKTSLLDDGRMPEEQLSVYEDCGWEYVTSRGILHFFRAPEGSDAPEFYQDPRQQAETLKSVRRSMFWSLVFCVVLIALLAPVVVAFGGGTAAFLNMVRRAWLTAPGLPAFWCLMLVSGLAVSILDVWQICRTYSRLKQGIPLDHAPGGKGRIRLILDTGLRWAAYLCLLSVVVQLITVQRGDLPVEPDGPYVVISDLGVAGERSSFMGKSSNREHIRSLFAEYWDTVEYVRESDQDPDASDLHLYQDIYRLSLWLDPVDWVRSLAGEQAFVQDLDEYTQVEIDGLDAAWLVEDGMEVVAVKDQMIACIEYLDGKYSTENLRGVLEALSARWAGAE